MNHHSSTKGTSLFSSLEWNYSSRVSSDSAVCMIQRCRLLLSLQKIVKLLTYNHNLGVDIYSVVPVVKN
jgi:hypothetical protein